MQILLDTHVFIWSITAPEKITPRAQQVFYDSDNVLHVSLISLWEIVIKERIGKLKLSIDLEQFVAEQQRINGVQILPFEFGHLLKLADITIHHNDPFVRAVIAQAAAEDLTIVTRDAVFNQYPVSTLW
jgi:PIN domain nuclease of toxin-antitoxin system